MQTSYKSQATQMTQIKLLVSLSSYNIFNIYQALVLPTRLELGNIVLMKSQETIVTIGEAMVSLQSSRSYCTHI